MKQRAEKHLEIALGGNMNIASLKPLALIEIMTDFAKKEVEAINYSQCCMELPNKMVIELSDEEMQIVSTDELIQMEKEAMEFDGFEGWIVKGKAAILK